MIAVNDDDLLADVMLTGRLEGIFVCPEGAATITAVRVLRRSGWIAPDDEVVLLNTGSGLLYPDAVRVDAPTMAPGGILELSGADGPLAGR